jgi:phosphomannomutase
MASAFKSGCIRGTYPVEWDSETVYRIGRYLPEIINVNNFVIGRDTRKSSDEIMHYLAKGLNDSGADVSDIGVVDTPALYFANVNYNFPGSIMITASHNPSDDNGMKIHTAGVINVTGKTGLKKLEEMSTQTPPPPEKGNIGKSSELDIRKDYIDFLSPFKEGIGPVKVVIECLNGSAGAFIHDILDDLPGEYILLNDKPDGSFPDCGPNPLFEENTETLINEVIKHKADFGICFDGDGDRAIFIDDNGEKVIPDLVLAYLARYFFIHFPEKKLGDDAVMYDLRCSGNVKDYVENILGGRAVETPGTGHTIMQNTIMGDKGLLGAELAGHYYFRDYYGQDTAWVAVLMALAIQSNEKKKFSELIKEIDKYSFSGEINFKVKDPVVTFEKLEKKYLQMGGVPDRTEGLKMKFSDWWFLVRGSGTEPVLRLVVQAASDNDLKEKVSELKIDIEE